MAKIFTVEDKIKDLNKLREEGTTAGLKTNITPLDEIFSIKKGYTLYIGGAPHSGKTEFINELALSMAIHYGWKILIYSGEAGGIENTIAELCHKLVGKPFMKHKSSGELNEYCMSDDERTWAQYVVSEHFMFIDTEDEKSDITSFKADEFYQIISDHEAETGKRFDMTILDPWNDVVNETGKHGGREDIWLAEALRICRQDAKRNQRYNVIIFHVAELPAVKHKESGKFYNPPALPTQWAGGRTPQRRAHTMLLCWRPPNFGDYRENEVIIYNQKAKPKGTGKIGECSLFWDWKSNRYYWQSGTQSVSAFDYKKQKPIEPPDEDPF